MNGNPNGANQRDENENRNSSWFTAGAAMAGLAALAGGVYWLASGSKDSKEEKPQTKKTQPKLQQRQPPASAASPTPTPSSTPSGGIMSGLINLLGALATPKSDTYYSSGKVARNAAPENPCISNLNTLLADIHVRHIQLKDDDFQLHYNVFDNVFQHLHKKMIEVDPYYRKYHSTRQFAGSHFDNLRIIKPDEFDMDIVIRLPLNISESSNRDESDIRIEPNTAGFVQLKMGVQFQKLPMRDGVEWQNNKAAYEWMDGSKYLLRSKFMDWWKSTVIKALKTFQHRDNVPIYFVNGVEYKIHKSESGPAMTLFIKNERRGFKLDVDLVPALKFPESRWPIGSYYRQIPPGCCKNTWMVVGKPNKGAPPHEQERSWRIALHNQERQLMHNSYHLRQAVRLNTWMVVGKPNKGAPPHEQERSWRIALHNQERELMHNSYHLRQAVRLLKKLRDEMGMKKIASYYIKTLFFWEIVEQNNKAFWRNNPAFLFKHMVKKLHTALVHSNIPYFWNKRNNLIGNVESRVLSGYAAKLVPLMQILDNPNGSNYKLVAKYLLSPKEFKEYNEKFLHI